MSSFNLTHQESTMVMTSPIIGSDVTVELFHHLTSEVPTFVPDGFVRLAEGSRLIDHDARELPPEVEPSVELEGVAAQPAFHAFVPAAISTSLPPIAAVAYALRGTLEGPGEYLNRCLKKFSPDTVATPDGKENSTPASPRKLPKLPMKKFFEYVTTIQRSSVDVLLLSPSGAKVFSRKKTSSFSGSTDVERSAVALYTNDSGTTYWPLQFESRRQPSVPFSDGSPGVPLHRVAPHDTSSSISSAAFFPPIDTGADAAAGKEHVLPPDFAEVVTSIEAYSPRTTQDPKTARDGMADPHWILQDRPATFEPESDDESNAEAKLEKGEEEDDDDVIPQPYAEMKYPNLVPLNVGFIQLTKAALKFKKNLVNFALTLIAGLGSMAIAIALIMLMLDRKRECCTDVAIKDSAYTFDGFKKVFNVSFDPLAPTCKWDIEAKKNATLLASDAMLDQCFADTCLGGGRLREEAEYGYFWNPTFGAGRVVVLMVCGSVAASFLTLLTNFFMSRALATGAHPRFWKILWVLKSMAFAGTLGFAAYQTHLFHKDFFEVVCDDLSTHASQLCRAHQEQCGVRLLLYFEEMNELRHFLWSICGLCSLGVLINIVVYPYPPEEVVSKLTKAVPDTSIFRVNKFGPDGASENQVRELCYEINAARVRPKHHAMETNRYTSGMATFLSENRTTRVTPRTAPNTARSKGTESNLAGSMSAVDTARSLNLPGSPQTPTTGRHFGEHTTPSARSVYVGAAHGVHNDTSELSRRELRTIKEIAERVNSGAAAPLAADDAGATLMSGLEKPMDGFTMTPTFAQSDEVMRDWDSDDSPNRFSQSQGSGRRARFVLNSEGDRYGGAYRLEMPYDRDPEKVPAWRRETPMPDDIRVMKDFVKENEGRNETIERIVQRLRGATATTSGGNTSNGPPKVDTTAAPPPAADEIV